MPADSRRGQHGPSFGCVAGKRLLAQDVLSGRDGLQGELGVGVGRRGDGDGVDAGDLERLVQRRARARRRRKVGPVRRSCPGPGPPAPRRRSRRGEGRARGCSSRSSYPPPRRVPGVAHGRAPTGLCRARPVPRRRAAAAAANVVPVACSASENTSTPTGHVRPPRRAGR